jgi:hypothetical protein
MTKPWMLLALCVVAVITGCATQNQLLTQRQGTATQTALQRAQFEMNCPSANATVLSSDYIQPAIQGPWLNGLQRVEYTVGVEGCGKREVYVVLCQVGTSTCFAANPNRNYVLQQ